MIKQTYLKTVPDFGKYAKEKISLQDLNKGIAFRYNKIKTLWSFL